MFGTIKKLSIAALFIGYTLLPMDLPVETPTTPISIIALLDRNIEYFTNALNRIDVNSQKPNIEDTSQERTKNKRLQIQHLLELNQSCKQEWQDYLSQNRDNFINQLQKDDARKEKEFSRQQDRYNTEMAKARAAHLLENHDERMGAAINKAVEQAQKKIVVDVNKMLQESNQRIHDIITTTAVPTTPPNSTAITEPHKISPEDHTKTDIAQQMNVIATTIEDTLKTLENQYQPEIEKNRQQIEALKKEKAILEKKRMQLNRFRYCMCAGITTLIVCTVFITKYFFPQ